jgi:hypothetical protein
MSYTSTFFKFVNCYGDRNETKEHMFSSAIGLLIDVFGVPSPLYRDL